MQDTSSSCADALSPTGQQHQPTSTDSPDNRSKFRRYRIGYFISSLGLGPAIAGVGTFVPYQLQNLAFAVGHEPGSPQNTGCPPSSSACLVKFGGADVNLTSYLLYMGATASAISGVMTLLISGTGDRLSLQREQYICLLATYGAFCLPMAALRAIDQRTLETFTALYVMCGILSALATAWSNIFVSFTMQQTVRDERFEMRQGQEGMASAFPDAGQRQPYSLTRHELQGLSMSVAGYVGLCAGQATLFLIAIGLTYLDSVYAGLSTTAGAGAVCIVLAVAAWPLLPQPPQTGQRRPSSATEWLALPFMAVRTFFHGLRAHHEAFKLLTAYTLYGDGVSTFDQMSGRIFNLTFRPSLREFTAYTLLDPVLSAISAILLLCVFAPMRRNYYVTLRHWMTMSFIAVSLCIIWAAIGLSSSASIGLKHRWEFYVVKSLALAANGVVIVCFRVSFPQLFPRGSEVQYFGIQLAVSLATAWIPGVVTAPIVNATGQQRVPALASAICLIIALGLVLWTNTERGRDQVRRNTQAVMIGRFIPNKSAARPGLK